MKIINSRASQIALLIGCTVMAFMVTAGAVPALGQNEDVEGQAVALFNQGQDAHEKGDLRSAIELYDSALKLIPAFPEAELQRGNAFVSLGRLDEAETAYRRAVALREDWTLAQAALGDVLVRRGKYGEAEPLLLKAIELDELNYPAYAALTELKLRTKASNEERTKLLANLRVLTAKASPTASIWTARGTLENSLGDRESAKSSLRSALSLEPKNGAALAESAAVALADNDPDQAAAFIKRLEAAAPGSVNVKILRARMLYANGDSDEALKQLSDLVETSSDAAGLAKEIAANSTADPAELEKQLASNAGSAVILGKLCSLLRIKDPVKALDYCRQAAAAEPTNISHAIGFAAALIQAKRFDEAISLLRRLLPSAPDNSTIRANLATALFFSNRYSEAKLEYRWLTDHQPNLAAAYYFLAISHDKLTEYADAMANYQQFLRLAGPESSLEVEKVNLRLPVLQRHIREGKGKRSK